MNIAIVDDIAAERALLRSRLERQLSRRNIQADLLEYDTGEAFLSSCAKLRFAVLFLDIYMDGVRHRDRKTVSEHGHTLPADLYDYLHRPRAGRLPCPRHALSGQAIYRRDDFRPDRRNPCPPSIHGKIHDIEA